MDDLRRRALEMADGRAASPAELLRVGAATSPEAARWAFGQWELRRMGRAKFSQSEEMLFVREALEQASHERVAAYHASLFPENVLVADLTAGIGSDLRALAARGPALGFELDPERAEYARHNSGAEVRVEDSLQWIEIEDDVRYAFADPARRVEGRRTLNLHEFTPDPARLAAAFMRLQLGVMKLSPMLSDIELSRLGAKLEFISFAGECKEVLVFAGHQAGEGRFAVHVESKERLPESAAVGTTESPGAWLYDADPAAVRAHALGVLCKRYGLHVLGDSIGYLTGDREVASPWLRRYRVIYHGRADSKRTRKALTDLGASTPELKQRGAHLDLLQERKKYALAGSRVLSLAIWPVGRSLRHTVLERS